MKGTWPFGFSRAHAKAYPLMLSLLLAGGSAAAQPADAGDRVLFAADPQIHNVYGLRLKQMWNISDAASRVAIRPPELNILAPLVFEHLVGQGLRTPTPRAFIILGDVTNIACSGEFDSFQSSLNQVRLPRIPMLIAHGNHDSYMIGTLNSFVPGNPAPADWKPLDMENSPVPTDEGWWGTTAEIDAESRKNWRDACFQPSMSGAAPGSPMNKSRWLARYLSLLERDGLQLAAENKRPDGDKGPFRLDFSAKPGSVLARANFGASGLWYPPTLDDDPGKSNLTVTYRSFLVQSIDLEATRIVLLDTSVCEYAGANANVLRGNAGQNACIGSEQLDIVDKFIAGTPKGHQLVLAGHFPLNDLKPLERKRLVKAASTKPGWIYMSAHRHHAVSIADWDEGTEVNVGSTTDWPMEVNVVHFQPGADYPQVDTIRNDPENELVYGGRIYVGKSEVCRHLAAAKALAELPKAPAAYWRSPAFDRTCQVGKKTAWVAQGNHLSKYLERIRIRFKHEKAYRKQVLAIAAAASYSEAHGFDASNAQP